MTIVKRKEITVTLRNGRKGGSAGRGGDRGGGGRGGDRDGGGRGGDRGGGRGGNRGGGGRGGDSRWWPWRWWKKLLGVGGAWGINDIGGY